MSSATTLEKRVAALESAVQRILKKGASSPENNNWRRSVGMFAGDEVMKEIDREGEKIRAKERHARRE